MKGILAWHDEPFAKTHSLEVAVDTCVKLDEGLQTALAPSIPLTNKRCTDGYEPV